MKDWAVGCIGIILGAFVGAILALFAMTFLNSSGPSVEPIGQPERPDITITASGPYVSSQMQKAIRASGLAKQASVSLAPPNRFLVNMVVSIAFAGQTMPINATATLTVRVVNGRALLAMEKVDIVGVGVPSDLVSGMTEGMRVQGEDQLNRMIAQSLQGTGLKLTNIRVLSDSVLIDLSAP